MKKILGFAVFILALFGAYLVQHRSEKSPPTGSGTCREIPAIELSHAENFGVDSCGGFRILWVRNGKSAPLRWILRDSADTAELPENIADYPQLRLPARRMVILSSTYLGYLKLLGVDDRIVGVDSKKYIADSAFYARVEKRAVGEVGDGSEVSPEAVFSLKPDAVFAFSTGTSVYDMFPKLERLRMPVVLTAEWSERSPLAKAEWIKFFGIFSGGEALADSLFAEMRARYESLKLRLDSVSHRPVVFTGTPSSGTWYASTGNGYMANLIRDAGGEYLWSADSSEGTLAMPFEKVFADVRNAEFWLNPGGASDRAALVSREARVERFPVWKTGEIYEYDLRKGPGGGLDFYEGAVVKPDSLLLDVAKILHPANFRDEPSKWYRKLSNI